MLSVESLSSKETSPITSEYFMQRDLLSKSMNLSKAEVDEMFTGKGRYRLITGFGLTGHFHLGSKLLLNEVRAFSSNGIQSKILLSGYDTLVKGVSNSNNQSEVQSGMLQVIAGLTKTGGVNVKINLPGQKSDINNSIQDSIDNRDFTDIFGRNMKDSSKEALIDMAASVLDINENSKTVVLLGIDELNNAMFINQVCKRLQILPPGFLFNRVLPGYDFGKMGKSRPEYSLVIFSNPDNEIKKVEKFLRTDGDYLNCPCYYVHLFSEFGKPELRSCNQLHNLLPKVIEKECYLPRIT